MQLAQERGITLPYTLIFDPATAEYEVIGSFDADPYEVEDGYGTTARTVRITRTSVRVSFKPGQEPYVRAFGYGQQVRKDGTLGRSVSGVSVYLTDIQTFTLLDAARNVLRKTLDAALGAE